VSAGSYLVGVLLVAIVVASLALAAVLIRRMILPAQSGAPARLAEAVIGIATLVVAAEALGAVGSLRRGALAGLCAAVALATVMAWRRRARGAGPETSTPVADDSAPPSPGRWPLAVGVVVVALALVPWVDHTLGSLHSGIREYDSAWYHMAFAGRFAQQASITGVQYLRDPGVSFFPANSELIHAVGIVLFGRDLLSPVLNLAWLGLALLAGWCIGRPRGVAPATMAACSWTRASTPWSWTTRPTPPAGRAR